MHHKLYDTTIRYRKQWEDTTIKRDKMDTLCALDPDDISRWKCKVRGATRMRRLGGSNCKEGVQNVESERKINGNVLFFFRLPLLLLMLHFTQNLWKGLVLLYPRNFSPEEFLVLVHLDEQKRRRRGERGVVAAAADWTIVLCELMLFNYDYLEETFLMRFSTKKSFWINKVAIA